MGGRLRSNPMRCGGQRAPTQNIEVLPSGLPRSGMVLSSLILEPRTLNLKSRGRVVTTFIDLLFAGDRRRSTPGLAAAQRQHAGPRRLFPADLGGHPPSAPRTASRRASMGKGLSRNPSDPARTSGKSWLVGSPLMRMIGSSGCIVRQRCARI
jgi:hypothetical protein